MGHHEFWYTAYVVGVYDGDSVTLDVDLGFKIFMRDAKMRLAGIDTAELRGDEREQGLVARDWLRERILNKKVLILTAKDHTDKYGRWLATVFDWDENGNLVNINDLLVESGIAKPYAETSPPLGG